MKTLGIVGLALGAIAAVLGAYNQFTNVAEAAYYMEQTGNISRRAWLVAHNAAMDIGYIVLFTGGVAVLISLFAAIKTKEGMAWAAVGISAIGLFFGLLQATHMFS